MSSTWHAMDSSEVLQKLGAKPEGLTGQEAKERLAKFGYNELMERRRRTALQMFLGEFKDVFVLLLLAASVLSAFVGYYESAQIPDQPFIETYADTITIVTIVILVAISGFIQEYRAEKALEALRRLTAPKTRALRDGEETTILAKEVVPGDVLVLEAGDTIPADARILENIELKADEAILTGESLPIRKDIPKVDPNAPVSDRRDMLYMATHVIYGRGKAIVTSTGMSTEFGKIAELVQTSEEEETPLQKKLDVFAKKIAKIVLALCAVIFVLEFYAEGFAELKGIISATIDASMSSISLAISVVPEGLPAIVTIGLALGARELAKSNAIIRKLSAAESLGAVTVICSDKTGTLTKGEMTVRKLYVDGEIVDVTGVGYEPKGEFLKGRSQTVPGENDGLSLLLKIGSLCSNAHLHKGGSAWQIVGDPTEGALIVAAAKAGFGESELQKLYPRIGEEPFTSERKRMTTVHATPEGMQMAFMKGAPEVVLERCTHILKDGEEVELTSEGQRKVLNVNEKLASEALRILGVAYKTLPSGLSEFPEEVMENGLVFVGLEGMIDPPREDAIEANKRCLQAGIKTVMITGDYRATAVAVAKEMDLLKEGDIVLTGAELDEMGDEDFEKVVENVRVYARTSPEHKMRIVNALKKKGHIVAMTGDGVNDAPAIKRADVGVAMGISGTDVTREASDIVLTDDNFATIVKAVEKGRVIYDNIRKYARFLMACNFDEVLVIGSFAILAGLSGIEGEKLFPLPLLPSMLLWINLATDGLPAVALSTDPPEGDIMDRLPRKPEEGILHGMTKFIAASFVLQAAGTLLVFILNYYIFPTHQWLGPNWTIIDEQARQLTLDEARTTAFVQATMFELFVVWNCRSETRSVWRMGRDAFKNKFFVIADLFSIAITFIIAYLPITDVMFHLVPLTITDLIYVIAIACLGFIVLPELFLKRPTKKV